MHEYNITEIRKEALSQYDVIIVLGTANKRSFKFFTDSVKESEGNPRIVIFSNHCLREKLESIAIFNMEFSDYEGNYDKRLVAPILQVISGSKKCAVVFFSQDPFIDRNDNVIEVAESINREHTIDLLTVVFGNDKIFQYDDIDKTWKRTEIFLQKTYRNLREKEYTFDDRSKARENLCIVLAGYKSLIYDIVFERIKTFTDDTIDICIVTSGMQSDEITDICRKNSWSYLSTKENNVSAVQNLAIDLHPNASGIYKLDEDMFITKHFFKTLRNAYSWAEKEGNFIPGIVVPLIPVNGYGSIRILEKLNLKKEYASAVGISQLPRMGDQEVFNDPRAARFFWGEGGFVPVIDELDDLFSKEPFSYSLCPIKFSIGALYFKRDFWKRLHGFRLQRFGASIGQDENQICANAMLLERPILVAENTVVGHLAFGEQTDAMLQYFKDNKELFQIKRFNED